MQGGYPVQKAIGPGPNVDHPTSQHLLPPCLSHSRASLSLPADWWEMGWLRGPALRAGFDLLLP